MNPNCRTGPVNRDELKLIAHDWSATKIANVCEEESEFIKKKGFRWTSEMIANLITCFMAYKLRMEYQALDFDGDRAAQYKEFRKELTKLYEIEDVSLFGPVSLSSPNINCRQMNGSSMFLLAILN